MTEAGRVGAAAGAKERTAWHTRREEYRVVNRIELRNQQQVFVRSAAAAASRPFLTTILEREDLAASRLNGQAEVVRGRLDNGEIVYPFLDKPTFEQHVAAAILKHPGDHGVEAVLNYRGFLTRLPAENAVPEAFLRFLGCPRGCSSPMPCLQLGFYDLIPRNILLDGGRRLLIDLEWTFDFPIPANFVLWRGLFSLMHGLQTAIQRHCSPDSPLLLYSGHGRSRVYLPRIWHESLRVRDMPLGIYGVWERLFRQQVLLSGYGGSFRTRLRSPQKAFTAIPGSNSMVVQVEEMMRRLARRLRRRSG